MDEQWKMKEILPSAEGEKRVSEENVDDDSSAGQLQRYYRQPRANGEAEYSQAKPFFGDQSRLLLPILSTTFS